jgi:Zn-dependent M28 family amino/carboxypeptidase
MKKLHLASALAGLALLTGLAATAADKAPHVDPVRLSDHVKMLSSNDFEGRGPGTDGETKATQYIVFQMRRMGLEPGGEYGKDNKRTWYQSVPLARFEMKGDVRTSVTAGGTTENWTQGDQIAIRAAQTGQDHVSVKDAPLVFVGYGVTAPERNWDDFKGVDLKGKVAVVLVNDPDFETGSGDFGGKAMTYYGRWTYKYEEAARRGAVGMLIVHETAPASYGWATVKNSNTNVQFDIVRDKPEAAHAPVEAWIQHDAAVSLFSKSGLDYEALKKQAQSRDFHPVDLKGASFSTDFTVDHRQVVSRNVVGMLSGTKHPDQVLMYTAHWDHLGVGAPDATGDKIYNGAVDNGTGVAALLEVARVFAASPRTERSVVFMAVTAEEKGLLGSTYYATHPLFYLTKTVGVFNMDALDTDGPARDMTTSGDGHVSLQDDLIAALKAHGRTFTPDPNPGAGHFYRSDHFPFAKVGVPAISIGSGEDLVKGGTAAGLAWKQEYTKNRYHQPADEWSKDWDLTGQAQDLDLMCEMGRKLANSNVWPEWQEGSEFKRIRDVSAAERK